MDLRSPRPLWTSLNPPEPARARLARDERAEVVVVGAGVVGALVAHRLAVVERREVIVLDRRAAGCGSTAASTALLQYETDLGLVELSGLIGARDGRRVLGLCRGAVREFAAIACGVDGGCGFERCESVYLAADAGDVTELRREFDARREAGAPVEWMGGAEVERLLALRGAPAAIVSTEGGQCDPVRLTRALLAEAERAGARVFEGVDVVLIESDAGDGGARLRTRDADGERRGDERTVSAHWAVVAGGYESSRLLREPVARLKSTFAIATTPGAAEAWVGAPEQRIIWETARPYFYLRSGPEGRLLAGGEDEDFRDPERRDALIGQKSARLLERLRSLCAPCAGGSGAPEFVIERAWAGTFGETKDSLAYIGAEPGRDRALFALGYGGNGMTFGLIAATIIADIVAGRANDDARLFRFGR